MRDDLVTEVHEENSNFDLSEAVVLYLKRYPGENMDEFNSYCGRTNASGIDKVRLILNEAMRIDPDWNRRSLNEAGDYVESVMHQRHPELTAKALEAIGNYDTYQMR